MNDHPLTPREKIEAGRRARETLGSFIKHHGRLNVQRVCAILCECLAWLKFLGVREVLENLTQLLKALILIPKFFDTPGV
jgi:hypothetical protein